MESSHDSEVHIRHIAGTQLGAYLLNSVLMRPQSVLACGMNLLPIMPVSPAPWCRVDVRGVWDGDVKSACRKSNTYATCQ